MSRPGALPPGVLRCTPANRRPGLAGGVPGRCRSIQRRSAGGGPSAGGGTGRGPRACGQTRHRRVGEGGRPRPGSRLDQAEANSFLPTKVTMQPRNISPPSSRLSAPIRFWPGGTGDIHNRDRARCPVAGARRLMATGCWQRTATSFLPTPAVPSEQSDGALSSLAWSRTS